MIIASIVQLRCLPYGWWSLTKEPKMSNLCCQYNIRNWNKKKDQIQSQAKVDKEDAKLKRKAKTSMEPSTKIKAELMMNMSTGTVHHTDHTTVREVLTKFVQHDQGLVRISLVEDKEYIYKTSVLSLYMERAISDGQCEYNQVLILFAASRKKESKTSVLDFLMEQGTSDGKLMDLCHRRLVRTSLPASVKSMKELLEQELIVDGQFVEFAVFETLELLLSDLSRDEQWLPSMRQVQWFKAQLIRLQRKLQAVKMEKSSSNYIISEVSIQKQMFHTSVDDLLQSISKQKLISEYVYRADYFRQSSHTLINDDRIEEGLSGEISSTVDEHSSKVDDDVRNKRMEHIRNKINRLTNFNPNREFGPDPDPVDPDPVDPDPVDPGPVGVGPVGPDPVGPDPVHKPDPDDSEDNAVDWFCDLPPLPDEWRADKLAVVCQLLEAGASKQILQAVDEFVTRRSDSDVDEGVEESATKSNSVVSKCFKVSAMKSNGKRCVRESAMMCRTDSVSNSLVEMKRGHAYQDVRECQESDPPLLSAWWIAVAEANQQEGNHDEATKVLIGMIEHGLRNGLLGDVSYANYLLGVIELTNHRPANAIRHLKKAIELHTLDPPTACSFLGKNKIVTRCAILSKLGMAHKNARDVGSAFQSYKQAIATGEATDQPTPDTVKLCPPMNAANLLHSVGDHTAAVPHYQKVIELSKRCGDMVSHAWAHGNLGNTYLSLSQHKLASHHLQLSLDLTLQYEPTPTAIGRAYNNLGTYYQAVGDLDKAQESYDTALGHGVYGRDQAGLARAYGNIGNVYMLKKNPERAIPHYSEVLSLSRDRLTTAIARHNRGCAYFELGEKKKVIKRCPNQYLVCGEVACEMESEHRLVCPSPEDAKHYHHALKDLDKVIVDHEETFASIKGSSSGLDLSVAWFETNAKTFLRAQDCAYSIGDHHRALVYAEQCRARTLGELLNSKTGHHGDTFNAPLQPDSISSVVRHLNTPNVPVVVLSYTGTRLLVWVLVWDGEEVKMTAFEQEPKEDMFDGKTFDHYIRYSLSEMLTGGLQLYGGLEDQTVSDESPAAKLFELIGRPLLRILEVMGCSGSRMVLIPDSYTKLLPFSALYDSKRQCFLGDSHSIVYSPSLLTLGVMSQMPPVDVHVPLDSDGMCVVGNPTTPPFKYNKEEWDLGPLPYATEEARSVALMLQTTPLLHQEATKDAVLSKLRQAKVVHLATHGSAGGGFLVLGSSSHNFATVTKHTVEDPSTLLLHASELESLDIPAALVVLSSCDSGRGVIRGDDIQGMARSFLLAGARAVLTSLWKAPDESASFFMQFFYRYLLDGHKASEALQKTSHSIRCFSKYSNFVHWSGHQLTGQDVMVTHTLSSEDRAVRALLGTNSTAFPHFDVLHSLTDALTNDSPTDVQLLCGPPGVDLLEPVTDFICSNYAHYPGGIVWLCSNDHFCLQDMSESSDRGLVILGGCDCKDFSSTKFLNSSNIDLIIITNGLADEMKHHVRSSLNRPVSVREVKPLSELHATQRLVYSVQSSFHLPPTAADQSAFQQLAHLTMGSPILVRMVQYLLHHNMKHSNTPSEGLLNTVHSIEDMLDDDDVLSTSRLAVVSAVCDTLSTAAQRLLHCLSCLDGLPVPLECIETIANMIQPPGQPLVAELRQAAVILGYPSPVVTSPTTVQSQSPLLYVPVTVAETVWTASSLHNKALSLLLIKNAILKGPYCDTVCHQVLKSWETTMISDSQDSDCAVILCLKEHIIELMEKCRPVEHAAVPVTRDLSAIDSGYQSDSSSDDIRPFPDDLLDDLFETYQIRAVKAKYSPPMPVPTPYVEDLFSEEDASKFPKELYVASDCDNCTSDDRDNTPACNNNRSLTPWSSLTFANNIIKSTGVGEDNKVVNLQLHSSDEKALKDIFNKLCSKSGDISMPLQQIDHVEDFT